MDKEALNDTFMKSLPSHRHRWPCKKLILKKWAWMKRPNHTNYSPHRTITKTRI